VAACERGAHRAALAARFGLDVARPWLLAVAMMRSDVKRDSYLLLAPALAGLRDLSWQLLVVGDGPARPEIEATLGALGHDRVAFAGLVPEAALPAIYASADLYVWPAVREAYGLAMLDAQAAGVPVVAGREGGVDEVVAHGRSGVLTAPRDPAALAGAVRELLEHSGRRQALAAAAAAFVEAEHSIAQAATVLAAALAAADAIRARRR